MEISLKDLAAALNAELVRGAESLTLNGVANLQDASPSQIAPFTNTNDTYRDQLAATRAGAVLAKRGTDVSTIPASASLLLCDDPEIVFLTAVQIFHPAPKPHVGVHSSAQIDPTARLGANVSIGPNAVIEAEAQIGAGCVIKAGTVIGERCELGEDCVIFSNVTLYPGSKLGKRVILHSGTVIGADGFGYKFRGGKHVKVPHVGWVEIADDVEIGANSCIDRGTLGPTRIGAGTKIDNLVQIAHNNTVGKHCIICGQVALAGSCVLEDYVVLGGNVGLADHTSMGKGSKAGAKSGVGGHIPAGQEVWGLFAIERSQAFKAQAIQRRLPEMEKRLRALEKAAKQSGPNK